MREKIRSYIAIFTIICVVFSSSESVLAAEKITPTENITIQEENNQEIVPNPPTEDEDPTLDVVISKPELKAQYNTKNIILTWEASAVTTEPVQEEIPGIIYTVYRKTSNSEYTAIYEGHKLSFTDKSTSAETIYYYKVTAKVVIDEKEYTAESNSVKQFRMKTVATPKISKIKQNNLNVKLTWASAKNAQYYRIYRKVSGGKWKAICNTSRKYYTDKNIGYEKKYYYKIKAYRKYSGRTGYSSLSTAKFIKTKLPYTKRLYMTCLLQNKLGYPSGCEVVSLNIVLKYLGINVPTRTLVNKYMRKQSSFYGKYNFNQAFLGSISSWSRWGGCYPNVIRDTANKYFKAKKIKRKAVNISGSGFKTLKKHLLKGRPVIVWATMGMKPSSAFFAGRTIYGQNLYWQSRSHTLVLTGYNEKKGVVYMADPLRGNVTYKISTFKSRYRQFGKRAVVIY